MNIGTLATPVQLEMILDPIYKDVAGGPGSSGVALSRRVAGTRPPLTSVGALYDHRELPVYRHNAQSVGAVYDHPGRAVTSDAQIRALAARLNRFIDDQEFRMRLAEERRVERIKKRYLRRFREAPKRSLAFELPRKAA